MPHDGIYLSNDTFAKLQGDLFEQDSRSTIADEWQRQATAAIPSMVADAQDRQQQAAQSQRDALADQFTASVPDLVAQHAATLTPPAPEPQPTATPPEPSQSATVAPDTAPVGPSGVVDTSAPSPQTPAAPTLRVSPPATPPAPATGYEAAARAAAQKYGIDPDLFARQISQESGFNPNAISPAGARGIAQFMPDTARGLGVNPDDPEQALDGAARYMAQLIGHNGGDVSKALAAYNAGQGNVDKYGGIPPFEETKRYVANIMSGAGQVAAGVGGAIANSGAGRVVTAAVNNVIGALRPSQFGVGLSDAEAYAACGPVAAMAFARATGQNPTAEQAVALAKQLGWTPAQGMAGPGSELDLLKNMGVPAHMEQGADPAKIAQDVQNGNPVIISTPGHYFVADGFDPQKGFHVGSSGTDLKAGSEWMSLDQMQRVMGTAQATLYLDRKPGDGPSVAAQMSQLAQPTDQVAASTSTPPQPQQSMWDKLGSGISDVFKNIFGGAAQMQAGQEAQTRGTTQAAEGLGGAVTSALAGAGGQMQTSLDLQRRGQTQIAEGIGNALTEPQPWMQNVVGAQTKQMRGEQLTPSEEYAQARGIATGLAQTVVPEDLAARAATTGAGSLARSGEVAQDVALSRQPAAATVGAAGGGVAAAAVRGAQAALAPLRNTPPEVQTVVRDFVGQMAEATGQADTLALRTRSVLGPADGREAAKLFERTGQFVENPTLEQGQHAADVSQFLQDTGDAGRQAGYIKGDVVSGAAGAPEHYFPHAYEPDAAVPGSAATGPSGKGGLNPRGSYSKARVFGTLEEAEAFGKTPVDSVSEPLRQYAENVLQSQAKAEVVARIKAIAPDAVIDYVPGSRVPDGYTPGSTLDPQLSNIALQEPIASALGNIINRGGGSAAGKAIMGAMGTAKEVMLSLSPFHLVTELRQAYRANNPQDAIPIIGKALWNMWSPNYDAFRLANSDLYEQAMRAGVTQLQHAALSPDIEGRLSGPAGVAVRGVSSGLFGAAGGYSETKREGGTDQQALENALKTGVGMGVAGAVLARPLADSLFSRVIPTMKALTWGIKTAGGADPQAAATFVNQTFGGQNLQMIARSPGAQQFLRIGMLAPDWWEGWARQVGGAFNPGDVGTMSRGYWARTLAEAGVALEGLNYALTGHFTNENGPNHQLDLETTPLTGARDLQTGEASRTYADVLGPLKSIAQLAASPAQPGGPADAIGTFVHNKSGLLPSTALSVIQNTDPATHQPIVPAGTPAWKRPALILEDVLSRLSPITAGQTMRTNAEEGPGAAGLSAGLGLRLTAQSPGQEAAALAFQAKQGRAEALQNNPPASVREDVLRLYADHGIAILPPPSTIALGGRTNASVTITPAEQVQHRAFLVDALNRNVADLQADPSFIKASRVEQERGLKSALSAAEKEARSQVLDSIPSADLNQRANTASQSSQQPRAPIPPARIHP